MSMNKTFPQPLKRKKNITTSSLSKNIWINIHTITQNHKESGLWSDDVSEKLVCVCTVNVDIYFVTRFKSSGRREADESINFRCFALGTSEIELGAREMCFYQDFFDRADPTLMYTPGDSCLQTCQFIKSTTSDPAWNFTG